MDFSLVAETLSFLTTLFVFFIGLGVLGVIFLFIRDVSQRKNAIQRNFPVVGHFRDLFTFFGAFFRQYFFAMDREELPFNRAERSWVYDAAERKGSTTIPFGSTRPLNITGTIIFANGMFPTLESDEVSASKITFGPYTKHPFETDKLFNISGMSYGAISKPAVLALSNGARMAGIWMNTGEGALSPYHLEGGANIIFQIGTAKFGVRTKKGELNDAKLQEVAAHGQVKMFELKLSQGAKPGKGGILPGEKVTEEIAGIRGVEAGKDAISPNRHLEIDSIPDLLDMISHIRDVTEKPVGMKCVVGSYGWVHEMCEEIHKRGIESAPDFITIDSADGGTGAAPMSLIDYMGIPLKESLPGVVDILDQYNLRPRIRVVCSGKLVTPAEVAWALAMGADATISARGFMFAMGCIQALHCNRNTCPTGITTHNKHLQAGLDPADKAVRVMNYANNIHKEVGIIAHSCGVTCPRQLNRSHARVVLDTGRSESLDKIFPPVSADPEYKAVT